LELKAAGIHLTGAKEMGINARRAVIRKRPSSSDHKQPVLGTRKVRPVTPNMGWNLATIIRR